MPDLVEQMYCSQQIVIPTNLPSILKKFAKAAIRTQPLDLLVWSSAYFKALANDYPPPVKPRIEYPPPTNPSGLSPGFLKLLINQIGKREKVPRDLIIERWKGVCLDMNALENIFNAGMFDEDVDWLHFIAICAGSIEPTLTRTMILLCELLSEEPEGSSAMIPVTEFLHLYKLLAKMDCGPEDPRPKQIEHVPCQEDVNSVSEEGEEQEDYSEISWKDAIDKLEAPSDESIRSGVCSDAGLMMWPTQEQDKKSADDYKEEDVEVDHVTSEYGLQVFTEVGQMPSVEEIKEINTSTEKLAQPADSSTIMAGEDYEQQGEGDEENIFAPKIDEFTTIFAEGEERPMLEAADSKKDFEVVDSSSGPTSTPTEKTIVGEEDFPQAEIGDDAEFMVLLETTAEPFPTPSTSNTSLLAGGNAEINEEKENTFHQLAPVMSLVDVQIHSPNDIQEKEVVHTKALPDMKWVPIAGVGPAVPDEIIDAVEKYFLCVAQKQNGMVMPRNIRHFLCPPMEVKVPTDEFLP